MLRIKSADKKDIPHIYDFCSECLLGTRIICQINAYGLDKVFFSVWLCTDDEEKVLGVICKFDDSVTLICTEEADSEDIRTFLDMIGCGTISCTFETAVKLKFENPTTKNAYIYKGAYDGGICGELNEDNYKSAYTLISKSIPDSFSDDEEAYLSFLSDFTYRKRRGMARIKGFTENGRVISCALTSAETENASLISGVACDPSQRKSGLGKKTVLSLAEELRKENKSVYVIALNESAEGFYEHIGFKFNEKISFIERK